MDTDRDDIRHNPVTVLLVDDQRLFVESLRVFMMTRAPDLNVVGVASDGQEAVEMAQSLTPDLVVMDVRMPGMDGVQASRILAESLPRTKVLMLTTFDDDSYVFEALKNGAVGYLLKDIDPAELVEAMRAAISGSVQISPKIATRLVSGSADDSSGNGTARLTRAQPERERSPGSTIDAEEYWTTLSRRERQIVRLVARGLDNHEIAEELNLAMQTVKNHISTIYEKVDVHNRVHLIRLCRSFHWGDR